MQDRAGDEAVVDGRGADANRIGTGQDYQGYALEIIGISHLRRECVDLINDA